MVGTLLVALFPFGTMCSLCFAKSLGFALIPLAICCIVANVLLFFPDGVVDFVKDGHLSIYVWSFMGIGGGGIAVSIILAHFHLV